MNYAQDSIYTIHFDKNIKSNWIYGKCTIKGKEYKFQLWDGNNNGIYNDKKKDYINCKDEHTFSSTWIKDTNIIFLDSTVFHTLFNSDTILNLVPLKKFKDYENCDIYVSKVLINLKIKHQFSNDSIYLHSLKDISKKFILINVWDPNCEPCLNAMQYYADIKTFSTQIIHINTHLHALPQSIKDIYDKYNLEGFKGVVSIKDRIKLNVPAFPHYILCDINFNIIKRSGSIKTILNYLYENSPK